jgi:hypothetical protein
MGVWQGLSLGMERKALGAYSSLKAMMLFIAIRGIGFSNTIIIAVHGCSDINNSYLY